MMQRKDGNLVYGQEVGTLVGHGDKPGLLEMVVAFSERDKAPRLGEFIIIEEREFLKRRILCRVEATSYGDFQTTRGERERALVEKYIRKVSGYDRALSEEEKKTLLFRKYTLRVLGEIRTEKQDGQERTYIATDHRLLPELTADCRYPQKTEFELIVSAGLVVAPTNIAQKKVQASKDTAKSLGLPTIGKLTFGEDVIAEIDIPFEQGRFEAKRTAIFARTGYGKSNLSKIVVALASLTSDNGLLVLDIDGEYAFRARKPDGSTTYGLADIDLLKPRLVVYTMREDIPEDYSAVDIRRMINLKKLSPQAIANLMIEQDLKVVQNFRNLAYLDQGEEEPSEQPESDEKEKGAKEPKKKSKSQLWTELVETLGDEKAFSRKLGEFIQKWPTGQRDALRREILRLHKLHDERARDLVEDVRVALRNKKLVILDFSLLQLDQAISVAQAVLDRVFRYNLWGITLNKAMPVVAVFEEAQNVLNKAAVEDGKTTFVRWAKEGRKFHLGLIYVTQQPGAIAEEIVSQTDNFFIMHLLNKNDIDSLVRANRHYDGVIAQFLSDETVVGNAYVYSAPRQPYVFPARLAEFTPDLFDQIFGVFRLNELATYLKSTRFNLSSHQELKTAIPAFSKVVHSWLKVKEPSVWPAWVDKGKEWIEWSYAESLLRLLDRMELFSVPQALRDKWREKEGQEEATSLEGSLKAGEV